MAGVAKSYQPDVKSSIMEILSAYLLAVLELTFTIISLMLLHNLKRYIGSIPLYLSLGAIMVFAQFVNAAGLRIGNPYPGLEIAIGPTIFFTPLMAVILITYILDGTVEAQRLIFGIMCMVAIFIYFSFLTESQCGIPGFELYPTVPKSFLTPIFHSTRTSILASLLSLLVVFLVLPIVYQFLRNRAIGANVAIFAALIITEIFDAFFYELVTSYPSDDWWEALQHSYVTRALAMVWVGCLTSFYVRIKGEGEAQERDERGPLDIFTGLLGSYGQAKRLQANVREWEGRYRMVVENSNDLILLVSQTGMILDTNRKALQSLGYTIEQLSHMTLETIVSDGAGKPCNWSAIWESLFADDSEEGTIKSGSLTGREFIMTTRSGESRIFDATLTPLQIQDSQAVLLVARDLTSRIELEKEREELQAQLIHSQRLEAVGRLAGGVAHDFNNMLHAIQGSLDVLEPIVSANVKARELTGTIATAVTRSAKLTEQLLGFARAGKYEVEKIDVADLVRQTESLFRPILGKTVKLQVAIHPDPMLVEGDFTQLEQVLLNILINARGALTGDQGTIIIRAEPAADYTPGWVNRPQRNEFGTEMALPPEGGNDDSTSALETIPVSMSDTSIFRTPSMPADKSADNYIVIRIKDNGCGMDEVTKKRIFEPFFTTNKQGGTGMGLAMAFGCIDNHLGWIHVETEPGKGAEFFLFLPRIN